MTCKYFHEDCINENQLCGLCLTSDINYKPIKAKSRPQLKKRAASADKRMGSKFEYNNHKSNTEMIKTAMTPNSGATGKIKGDEQISGIINIMEELKTKVTKQVIGKESFTVHKKWLTKLNKEAQKENKEFWYLKFCFNENDSVNNDNYIIVEQDIIMSMVKTMIKDRISVKVLEGKINMLEKISDAEKAARLKAEAELASLKSKIDLTDLNERLNKLFDFKEE
jgi:hypothetical protein